MASQESFELFARSNAQMLQRTAWLLCRDRHTAEDLVQETLELQYTCRTLDDGTVVVSVTAPTFTHYSDKESGPDAYESDRPGEEEYSISVDVISPDGRVVSVSALNATSEKGGMTCPDPALSRDELIKVAQNPAWTDLPPLP